MAATRISVVTGGNKGIGFEICKQLASNGIKVVLTARDEKRGLEAVEKLREFGEVTFHQLDVTHPASFATLANFIKTQFGKLDILVNNAGILGSIIDRAAALAAGGQGGKVDWSKIATQTNASVEAIFGTNYYGAKGMCEALIPLLELSESPRIINVSSSIGNLSKIPSGWAKGILSDAESLTEENLDEILNQFLKDFKDGSLETKSWPPMMSAYAISKAVLNGYTRILAKKHPSISINAVCPGYVNSDFNSNTGHYSTEEGAACAVRLALLPNTAPSGLFFSRTEVAPF